MLSFLLTLADIPVPVNSDIASPVTFTSSEKVDPAELAKRTAFLRGQRDKLLAMKVDLGLYFRPRMTQSIP
jgi:hypothetical protein